jgi:hypothetical protein
MAMFKFNINLISYLNTFDEIGKDRYLSWWNKHGEFTNFSVMASSQYENNSSDK